jgi:protein-S-isoprenylcysteine O-methyltransferase Ste14
VTDPAWLHSHLPLVRLALCAWCLVVWAAGACLLRPTPAEQRAGVMAAWVHTAVGVLLDALAVRLGAWEYRPMPFALGGVPLDLHVAWGLVWGFLPPWLYSRLGRDGSALFALRPVAYVGAWALGTVVLDAGLGRLLPFLAGRAPGWWRVDGLLLFILQGLSLWVYLGILRPAQSAVREVWRCRVRSLLYLGSLAALFYGYLPAVVLSLTGGWETPPLLGMGDHRVLALALALPIGLGAWATLAFTDVGGGTPLPPDPPRRLVTTGPYAYVRNPMQIAGLGLSVLLMLYHPTPFMLLYIVDMALVAVVLFAPYERAQLSAAFGEEYRRYVRCVRTWLPHPRPYDRHGELRAPAAREVTERG